MKNLCLKISFIVVCVSMLLSFPSCQKSPEISLVVNKSLDKLIEEAGICDDGKVYISDIVDETHGVYKTIISNSNLGVSINVDARVDIPEVERLSLLRVEQKRFSQETIDSIKNELVGNMTLYNGSVLDTDTKTDIAASMASVKNEIENIKTNPSYSKEQQEQMIEMYQTKLNELSAEYSSAPEKIILSEHPSDGQLCKVYEKYKTDGENEFYSHRNTFIPDGEVIYEVSDTDSDEYISVYVQNDEKRGTRFSYRNTPLYFENNYGVTTESNAFILYAGEEIKDPPKNLIVDYGRYFEDETVISAISEGKVDLSKEDAIKIADEFLEKIGINDFAFYEGDLYSEIVNFRDECFENKYRESYILRYYRNINGAFVTQSAVSKEEMAEPGEGNTYSEYEWDTEYIEFRINDDGIVGFDYNHPIRITETVIDNAALMSFENICDSFEKIMPVVKASQEMKKRYQIDNMRLSYSRISVPNSNTTGVLVPVWDFSGAYEGYEDEVLTVKRKGRIFCINAIDGSIIDPELGY